MLVPLLKLTAQVDPQASCCAATGDDCETTVPVAPPALILLMVSVTRSSTQSPDAVSHRWPSPHVTPLQLSMHAPVDDVHF